MSNNNTSTNDMRKWYEKLLANYPILMLLGTPIWVFLAAITGFNIIGENPPLHMEWLPRSVVPLSILITILTSSIIWGVYLKTNKLINSAGVGVFITALVATLMLVCYFISVALPTTVNTNAGRVDITSEPIFVTRVELEQLRQDLSARNLNQSQIDQVLNIVIGYLTEKSYLTSDDANLNFVDVTDLNEKLSSVGFNETQQQEIRKYFSESGFLTQPEVINIVHEEQTRIAIEQSNLRATQEAEKCFVTPKSIYSNLAIRPIPSEENNVPIGYLYLGERIQVIGHNMRNASLAKWWLVSLDRVDRSEQGWILSSVTDELNPVGCALMQPIPGT